MLLLLLGLAGLVSGCGAAAVQVIPTDPPTATMTFTPTVTRTPGAGATPTITPTPIPASPTGGPSPTPLFGPTRTPPPFEPTATRVVNPNAPRIEFFTSDVIAASPGSSITLYWSTRNVNGATIYRLDRSGARNQLWNVPPDGNLVVPTRRSDRDEIRFLLIAGDADLAVEAALNIPLACPEQWFFEPQPDSCPTEPAQESQLLEQRFERGRMLYVENTNQVYGLFNDGFDPAWISFENRYNPEIHAEFEESFVPPPGFYQPTGILGFVWRGSDTVRSRLGLALEPQIRYEGTIQTATLPNGEASLYASSTDGTVLQLIPGGAAWQIITAP